MISQFVDKTETKVKLTAVNKKEHHLDKVLVYQKGKLISGKLLGFGLWLQLVV